jgi:hypothetical protein
MNRSPLGTGGSLSSSAEGRIATVKSNSRPPPMIAEASSSAPWASSNWTATMIVK